MSEKPEKQEPATNSEKNILKEHLQDFHLQEIHDILLTVASLS